MKNKIFLVAGIIVAVVISACVTETAEKDTEITIYNQNFGVVKETREIELEKGMSTVMIQDVAKLIDPTSVSITDLTASTAVLEQNYLYDLVSKEKIYEKYTGKEISLTDKNGDTIKGTLLSYSGDELVIQNDDGVHILKAEEVSLPTLPEGLITKPTLQWLLDTDRGGDHNIQLSYITSGLNWKADYVAVVNNDDSALDLTSWVTLDNRTGASYKNAKLKLIAGDVHRVEETDRNYPEVAEEKAGAPAAPHFEEESFFEYHMYTLQRTTDVLNNQQKQVTLFETDDVTVEKEYVFDTGWYSYYYGSSGESVIKTMLSFENVEENNMGMPLPKGTVKVYKKDSEGQLQFIGEDSIDHTPKDEKIRIYLGDAFDLVGEKKQTDYERIGDDASETGYEVTLRNHKDEDVTITVIGHLWGDWTMTDSSHDWEKEDANTVVWHINVPEDGETTLTYTVRVEW
ncbi:MAG: DUF4139 domain-containing protein [Euryarchaeota archaeon]|nr:DUF4139 domain-containing protein [Euryarchaeota archaeon]